MQRPYPDLDLIKRLRGKFLEHTVHSLSTCEIVNLINHQNERILDLARAYQHAVTYEDDCIDFLSLK